MNFTDKQLHSIVNLIADRYRICLRITENPEIRKDCRDEQEYVTAIERALQDCSCDTQLLIRKILLQTDRQS